MLKWRPRSRLPGLFMIYLRQHLFIIAGTAALYLATIFANQRLFPHSEFMPGANWVYLPAGMRLLCTLLFAEAGAIGMLIASWLSCFVLYYPDDPVHSLSYGTIAGVVPYLIYLFAKRVLGLRTSLSNLTPARLLFLIALYAIAGPALHELWFALHGDGSDAAERFEVTVVGDLTGSLIVIYAIKLVLWLAPGATARRMHSTDGK
jgi:hypothetical protein